MRFKRNHVFVLGWVGAGIQALPQVAGGKKITLTNFLLILFLSIFSSLQIKTFANYNKWKAFRVWKKLVRRAQISRARDNLEKRLFVCNRTLFEVFLEIKKMCANLESASFADVADVKNVPFFIFVENHVSANIEKHSKFQILRNLFWCFSKLTEVLYRCIFWPDLIKFRKKIQR